jgi:hypothetical protein
MWVTGPLACLRIMTGGGKTGNQTLHSIYFPAPMKTA